MEERESNERKNLFIKTIIVIILLLLAFLSTILYVYLYPKTRVFLYDTDYTPIRSFEVKRYSNLESLPDNEKSGYTFKYWTYDDFELNGGTILDKQAELTSETVSLYANYQANKYRVTYHIQYFDETTGQYMYKTYTPPRNTYPEIYEYGSKIDCLPTGRDAFNNLLPDFDNKPGYHFVGWTTKVMSEDDPEIKNYLKYAGQEYVIDIPSDIDFYAYFEKNTYQVNMHTGIQYQLDGLGQPKKDASGEYIIKNITGDSNNDRDSLIAGDNKVRYMDSLVEFVDNYSDIKLTEKNGGMAYDEYEFMGWYLDEDYTYAIKDQELKLLITEEGRPYYQYILADGSSQCIYAFDTGDRDVDDKPIYAFDLYSKWQRKQYEISFNKNSNSASGKIESIYLYRVFLDTYGKIEDEYGKYYDDGEFTYEGYANGGHYYRVNLDPTVESKELDIVGQEFRDSNKNYRLVGWTDSSNSSDSTTVYALWQQDKWTEELGKNRQTGLISYENPVYKHTVNENVTLYAQWSRVYTIKFAYDQGSNQKYFEYKGIYKEWFILPNMKDIETITGSEWTKKYNYFAGWRTGTSERADKYVEKQDDGSNNPNYYFTVGQSSATLIVYWKKTPYTINFYLNDNDSSTDGGSVFDTFPEVYGGTYKYFTSKIPTREGYIFDGWSLTDYKTNEYSTIKRKIKDGETVNAYNSVYTSSSNFLVSGDCNYYASWTTNFEIEYDANGGSFANNTTTKYTYSANGSGNLKINLYVGSGQKSISRENYIFKGWKIKGADGQIHDGDALIKTSDIQRTTFDFYKQDDGKYYYYNYKSDGITVADDEKTAMYVEGDKKVVLMAVWEPKKYNITIKDTLASGDKTSTQITITVAFDEAFTFPDKNALNVLIDSKIGYKLIGFAKTEGGDVEYAIAEDGKYPTIEANTISKNMTFYTVYEQKNIRVEFKAKMPDGESIESFDAYTMDSVAYGASITLPTIESISYNSKILKFKYWYYEKDGDEIQIASGDKVTYHNDDNILVIYGHFEVDSYTVTVGLSNPYTNQSLIIDQFSIGSFEKDMQITENLYIETMDKVYSKLETMLGEYVLDKKTSIIGDVEYITSLSFKGFSLTGLCATGGYEDYFSEGKQFNSRDFRILGFTTSGMTIATIWSTSNVDIVYKSDEGENPISNKETVLFTYSPIVLKGKDYLTLDNQEIKSWYIKDGGNIVFLDLSSTLVGVGSRYGFSSLNDLQKYISWDKTTGKGTLEIFANTAQICKIEYYTFSNSGTPTKIDFTDEFVFDNTHKIQSGDIAILEAFAGRDFKFNGWYMVGNSNKIAGDSLVSVIADYFTDENTYTVKLYADLTINKSVYITKLNDNVVSEELYNNDIISILMTNASGEYIYATSLIIDSYPQLTADQIPSGYDYYGLRYGDKTFTIGLIEGDGAVISITGYDIKLVTYYTKEYTITYKVTDGATFDDGSTDDIVEKYLIGLDGVVAENKTIKINYTAKKTGYDNCFDGWRMQLASGTIGDSKYTIGQEFTPVYVDTIFVPAFKTPEQGTINAKIKLIREDGSDISKIYSGVNTSTGEYLVDMPSENGEWITNGDVFSFARVQDLWTESTRDLYKWVDSDGNEYDATTGEFVIPDAIENDQVFTFTGVWIDKYFVRFTQPKEYSSAEGYDIEPVAVHKGVKYSLASQDPVIKVNGSLVEGLEFKYWTYQIGDNIINIESCDSIVLNSDEYSTYKYVGNADGSGTHYLPALADGTYEYLLLGAWDKVYFDITLKVANPTDNNQIYTLTLFDVPFGATIASREMLDADCVYLQQNGTITTDNYNNLQSILSFISDDRGIVGWSTTLGGEAQADILDTITSSMTLYAVWQVKQTLKFASSSDDTTFGYTNSTAVADSKYLPTEQVDVNNVIQYVYQKGYATVHLEDGKWIVYREVDGIENYYYLQAFSTDVAVNVNGESTNTLAVDENGEISLFEMPNSDVTLTPVMSRIYRINFWDNTTSTGGEIVKNDEGTVKYVTFARTAEVLNLSSFTTTRKNFTFLGWHTDKDSNDYIKDDNGKSTITIGDSDVNLYAIWASNRRAVFQISLASTNGVTNETLLQMPLTKDNKINISILEDYLQGKNVSSNNVIMNSSRLEVMETLSNWGHSAYIYNFNTYLLNSFIVSKNGVSTTLDMSALEVEDFGDSDNYNQNENVIITFNLYDVYTITYNSTLADVEGSMSRVDYFVASGDNVGKLVAKSTDNLTGIESTLVLPTASDVADAGVSRRHYVPSMWATDEVLGTSTIKYNMSNVEDLTLSSTRLRTIASSLRNKYNQEYKLYIIWDYEYITTYVYAPAEIVNTELEENQGKADTTLLDPYPVYLSATSVDDIVFQNIPDILSVNGVAVSLVGNYQYNYGSAQAKIKFGDVLMFTSNLDYSVGGYTLIGFSTTLFKLGEVVNENNYFKLDTQFEVVESMITGDAIKFYPVYSLQTKDIIIYSSNGTLSVSSTSAPKDNSGNVLTTETAGLVYLSEATSSNSTIASNKSSTYSVNIHTSIVLTANVPDEGFVFEQFSSSLGEDSNAIIVSDTKYIGTINIPLIYSSEFSNSNYNYYAIYGESNVKINFTIDYGDNPLKSGITDNFEIAFGAISGEGVYNEKTLDRLTLSGTISTTSVGNIYYSLSSSNYYTFEMYDGDQVVTLKEGTIIEVSKLTFGAKDEDGFYNVNITIKAVPITKTVTFVMNRGVFKENATMSAESSIYEGVRTFAIVGNIANVFAGSIITLPTAEDINYSSGKFIKFYINGDTQKTAVTSYTINQNITFVEDFDDNAYTIQYNFNGKIEYVSGITPNSPVKIGYLLTNDSFENPIDTTKAGYTLQYWTFENGEKAFDDGQKITLTKSYILYAKYLGNEITYKFEYPSNKYQEKTGYNGSDIVLLDPADISDADLAEGEYIYGWKYNGHVFAVGTISFDEITNLGYEYSSENTEVVFEAQVYDSYKYIVSYVTTTENGDLTNASEFEDQTFYVKKLSNNTYSETDREVYISDKIPTLADNTYNFKQYTVEISEDGETYTILENVTIKVGGLLLLATPVDGKIIRYRLTPEFTSTNSTISINYNLMSPSTNESVNTLTAYNSEQTVEAFVTNLDFNAGLTFSDNYMLQLTTTAGSDIATFDIDAMTITFRLQITQLDWHEYILKGYNVALYLGEAEQGSRNFYFGNSSKEDRNISGVDRAVLTPIWEKKYVVSYYNQDNSLIQKDYIAYSSSLTEIPSLDKTITTDGNLSLVGYACVGWTTIADNNHIVSEITDFVSFTNSIAISKFDSDRNISLYPAQSKIYTLSFETFGIDENDVDEFIFNSFDMPQIYLGINEDNAISLDNYLLSVNNYFDYSDLNKLYSSCLKDKYTFLGFSSSKNGIPSTLYTFDSTAIDGDNIVAYVVWQKNSYNITFTFEAYANGGTTNLLGGYSFEISKFYGDKINLKWDYDLNTNTFSMLEATKDDNVWISNIKNESGVALIEKINTILQEKGIDYLSAMKFTHSIGDVETQISVDNLFTITNSDNIKITFDTYLIRLTYNVYYGTEYQGTTVSDNTELYSEYITIGSEVTPQIDIADLSLEGYVIDFWSADDKTNFFPGGKRTINSSDVETSKLDSEYRLNLLIHFTTAYELNFYYFASLDDLLNNSYTKLGTFNVELGDTIGIYQTDENGSYNYDENGDLVKEYVEGTSLQKTIFDEYLSAHDVNIVLNRTQNITTKINNFHDFLDVFQDYEYISHGELRVNEDEYSYLALENDENNYNMLYQVMTYAGGDALVNNVYLTYEVITHNVKIRSVVGVLDDDGETVCFNQEVASKYDVYAEYATNYSQIANDNGDANVEFADMRNLANTYNEHSYTYAESISYLDHIYLVNQPFAVRGGASATDFIMQGWRVLVEDESGTRFVDISEYGLTITPSINGDTNEIMYWTVSNVKEDVVLVAVYTERLIDVTVTLKSEDNNGESLNVSIISEYNSLSQDYSELEEYITRDSDNHSSIYNLKILYNSWLSIDILDSLEESYQLKNIKIGTYETSNFATIAVNESNIDTVTQKINIEVTYSQLTYQMLIKAEQNIDGTRYNATLDKINYSIVTNNVSYNLQSETEFTNNEFGYTAEIATGAIIQNDTLGTPVLNNYAFVNWQYYVETSDEWLDLQDQTNGVAVKDIVNEFKEVKVRAVFTAGDVQVQYVLNTSDSSVVIEDLTQTVKYGSKITLPYVIIENENYITTGFDIDGGQFGNTIQILSRNNAQLTTYSIPLLTQELSYVVFDKGETTFDIPTGYPTTKNSDNKIASIRVEIPEGTTYYYNTISAENILGEGKYKTTSASEIIVDDVYSIPNIDIADSNGASFAGWTTKLNRTYNSGESYDYLSSESENNLITLTALESNFVNVKFYITNPVDAEILNLTTKVGTEANMSYISVLIDKELNFNYIDVDYEKSADNYLNINSMSSSVLDVAYFANLNDYDQYKFYGWSTEKIVAFNNINEFLTSSDNYANGGSKYLSYYNYSTDNGITEYSKYNIYTISQNLGEFVMTTGAIQLYSVWEKKYKVSFRDEDDNVYTDQFTGEKLEGYFGQGEIVNFPNSSNLTLTSSTLEWIGWQDKNGSRLYEFVNGKASMTFAGTNSLDFYPLWEDGYTLTLDMNFAKQRETVATVLALYGVTKDQALANTGYPFFAYQDSRLKGVGGQITLGDKTYNSAYQYGVLWRAKEVLDISIIGSPVDCYDNGENVETIYPVTITPTQANWLNSYYTFAGWSYTQNGEVLTQEELSAIQLSENTTLYAIWEAVELKVYMSATYEDAEYSATNVSKILLKAENEDIVNPIVVKFGEIFNISDYEGSFVDNYSALSNDRTKKFSKWNVVSPLTQDTLHKSNFYIANDLYLYPNYVDCYTVIFKTTKGDNFTAQGDNLENCQRVIEGDVVRIEDYIKEDLGQDLTMITSVFFNNNNGEKEYIYDVNSITEWVKTRTFTYKELSTSDRLNKTFTIYIDISFEVHLYAPESATSNVYVQKSTVSITPEINITVFKKGLYATEYNLDLSQYSNVPQFAGWYYYDYLTDSEKNIKCYTVDDLSSAVCSYKLVVIDGKYHIVIVDTVGNETAYQLSGRVFNLYAKLTVTQEITLGDADDTIIQKYASLSLLTSDYVNIVDTTYRDGIVKSINVLTAYNSDASVYFTITSEGYIIRGISKTLGDATNDLEYIANNDNLENEQTFENNTIVIAKKTSTSKSVEDVSSDGMFIEYKLSFKNIRENGRIFTIDITPYVFDVEYKVKTVDGLLRTIDDGNFNPEDAITMTSENLIYQILANGNEVKAFESNKIAIAYTYVEDKESGYTILRFVKVPYSMFLQIKYIPQEIMLKRFVSLEFDWTNTSWNIDNETNADISSIQVSSAGKNIQFKPVENDGTTFVDTYNITVGFENNKIKQINLFLDHENIYSAYDKTNAWTNILDKKIDDVTTSKIQDDASSTRYALSWKVGYDDSGSTIIYAGDDLSSLFTTWKGLFHSSFESQLDSDSSLSSNNISLSKAMQYFWLNDDVSQFQTYSKYISEASTQGYLDGTTIYSLHNGVVELHIDLEKAFLVDASNRILDYYTDGKVVVDEINGDGVDRADISLNSSTENYKVYVNNKPTTYTANTPVNRLVVKMPYENSDVTFITTPANATTSHVAYQMSQWVALDGGTITTTAKDKNTLNINTNNANNNVIEMFAQFSSGISAFNAPEIHLRGDVIPQTYQLTFANSDSSELAKFDIAYDEDIYNSNTTEYMYYKYTIGSLSASDKHIIPLFKLIAPSDYTGNKFIHPSDNISDNYGSLKYLFTCWSNTLNGSEYNLNWLVANKIVAGNDITYGNITLYAVYTKCTDITVVTYVDGGEANYTLSLAPLNFQDQFGNTYDTSLLANDYALTNWLKENKGNAVLDTNGKYEYYLKGTNNTSNIKVSSLQDIVNAYNNNSSVLAEANEYRIYPKMEITLIVYKHDTDNRYSSYEKIYFTLGGKIVFDLDGNEIKNNTLGASITVDGDKKDNYSFSYNSTNLVLSNLIWTDDQTYVSGDFSVGQVISPETYTDYTFAFWYVNTQYVVPFLTADVCVVNNATIYPHYNVKFTVSNSKSGTSKIFEQGAESSYSVGNWIPLLSTPSCEYITAKSNDLRHSFSLNYSSLDVDANGYCYALLDVIDEDTAQVVYTIKFVANDLDYEDIAFEVTTSNGKSQILTLERTSSMYLEDGDGSYKINPVAYPDEVKITVNTGLTITNLPDPSQYLSSVNLTMSANPLTIKGGSSYKFAQTGANNNLQFAISFENIFGEMTNNAIVMTTNSTFASADLGNYLQNFRWQYLSSGSWIDCNTGSMMAIQDITLRLACDWITYNISFEKMSDQSATVTQVSINGEDWNIKDRVYSNYSINNAPNILYKGETLDFNYSNYTFALQSNINGRGNINITTNIGSDGTWVGWIAKSSSGTVPKLSGLTKSASFTAEDVALGNLSFVAWAESTKNADIKIDKSISNYGYADITVEITSPMGYSDQTVVVSVDKANKEYKNNSLTLGYSSLAKFTITENNDVKHDLHSFNYNGENININSEVTKAEYSGVSGSDMLNTIYVGVDAEPTKSYYYVVDSFKSILKSYPIYGGYYVNYSYNKTEYVLTARIYNYWNQFIKSLKIHYNENKDNDTSSIVHKFYPNNGYSINELNLYKVSSITTKGNTITSTLGNVHTIADMSGCKQTYTNYIGDLNKLILKFTEYVSTATFNFFTHTTFGDNSSATSNGTTIINSQGETETIDTQIVEEIPLNGAITYLSNVERGGVVLNVANKYNCTIPRYTTGTDRRYTLVRVVIREVTTQDQMAELVYNDTSTTGSLAEDFTMSTPVFEVYVYTIEETETTLSFKSTLPNEQDFRNIKMTTSGGTIQPQFNTTNKSGQLEEITIEIGSKVSIENNGKTLVITTPNGSDYKIIINGNLSIYEFQGWYLDTIDHSLDNTIEKSIGGIYYNLYSYNSKSQKIGTVSGTETTYIYEQSTLVLAMNRKPVTIYRDTTTWNNLSKSSDSTVLDQLKKVSYSAREVLYTLPGGLVTLTPADLTEDIYQSGSNAYLGVDNSTKVPMTLNNVFREQRVSSSKVFTITRVDKEETIGYIGGTGQFYYSGYYIAGGIYNVELTTSSKWILVEYPAKINSINITFHSREYNSSDDDTTTLEYSRLDTLDLSHTRIRYINTSSNTYTTSRNPYSRLYYGLSYSDGYEPVSITFYRTSSDSDYLSEYRVITSSGSTYYTSYLDLSATRYAGASLDIYPVFIKVYTVTIKGPFFGTNNRTWGSESYEVIPGEAFTFSRTLDSIELTYNSYGSSSTFKTIKYGSQVVAGLGNYYTLLYVSNGTLYQNKSSLDMTFTPSGDTTITATMLSIRDVELSYTCSNYSDYDNLSFDKTQTFKYSSVPSGVNPGPSNSEISLGSDANYFSATITSSSSFKIEHTAHNMQYTGETSAQGDTACDTVYYNNYECKYCTHTSQETDRTVTKHTEKKYWYYDGAKYGDDVCVYIKYCSVCDKQLASSTSYGHKKNEKYTDLNYTTHKYYAKCTRCNHEWEWKEDHDWQDTGENLKYSDKSHTVPQKCSDCGRTRTLYEEHEMEDTGYRLIEGTSKKYTFLSGSTGCQIYYQKVMKCKYCTYEYYKDQESSYYDHDYLWEDGTFEHVKVCSRCDTKLSGTAGTHQWETVKAATCSEKGNKYCTICYANRTINKKDHNYELEVVSTSDGSYKSKYVCVPETVYKYVCTRCNKVSTEHVVIYPECSEIGGRDPNRVVYVYEVVSVEKEYNGRTPTGSGWAYYSGKYTKKYVKWYYIAYPDSNGKITTPLILHDCLGIWDSWSTVVSYAHCLLCNSSIRMWVTESRWHTY